MSSEFAYVNEELTITRIFYFFQQAIDRRIVFGFCNFQHSRNNNLLLAVSETLFPHKIIRSNSALSQKYYRYSYVIEQIIQAGSKNGMLSKVQRWEQMFLKFLVYEKHMFFPSALIQFACQDFFFFLDLSFLYYYEHWKAHLLVVEWVARQRHSPIVDQLSQLHYQLTSHPSC